MLKGSIRGHLPRRHFRTTILASVYPAGPASHLRLISGASPALNRALLPSLTELVTHRTGSGDGAQTATVLQAIDAASSVRELQAATKKIPMVSNGSISQFLTRVVRKYAQLCGPSAGAHVSKSLRRLRSTILSLVEDAQFLNIQDLLEVIR